MKNTLFINLIYGILFLFFFIAFSMTGCEEKNRIYVEDCENYDYSDCQTTEPTMANLNIKVSINTLNSKIPVVVFKGYIDNKDTLFCDTITSSGYAWRLPVNQYYSVMASYNTGAGLMYALDGGRLGKSKQRVCDSICWWEKSASLDLRLSDK